MIRQFIVINIKSHFKDTSNDKYKMNDVRSKRKKCIPAINKVNFL